VNGLSLFEEHQAHSVEHLVCTSTTLQEGLLQSLSPRPGKPEVLSVFPAWPKVWDASFRLLARGGFLVTAAIRNGKVKFVEIESRLGEACQLRNPWGTPCLVTKIGGSKQELDSDIFHFDTGRGKRYRVSPKDSQATPRHISPEPATNHTFNSVVLTNR